MTSESIEQHILTREYFFSGAIAKWLSETAYEYMTI